MCCGMYHTNTRKRPRAYTKEMTGCFVLVWVTFSLSSWVCSHCGIKCFQLDNHHIFAPSIWDKMRTGVLPTEHSSLGGTEGFKRSLTQTCVITYWIQLKAITVTPNWTLSIKLCFSVQHIKVANQKVWLICPIKIF